jgi:hypothetical protein
MIHNFHGVSTRVAPDETAFANRREHFVVEIVAGWERGTAPLSARLSRRGVGRACASRASRRIPKPARPDDHEQIANAYGDNGTRLVAAKRHFDPDGVFNAIPLPRTGRGAPCQD